MQPSFINNTPPQRPATSKRELLFVALGLALFGLAVLRPSIHANDGLGHFAYLASWLSDGDFALADDYREFDRLRHYPFQFSALPSDPATGRASNRYGVGAALLWSPFVIPAHYLARAWLGAAQMTYPHRAHEWGVGLGTLFWGSLGLWLLYRRLRREFALVPCLATLLGLLLATPLGFYLYAHGSMAHGVNFFAMVVLLLAWERAEASAAPPTWFWFGAAAGLVLLTRVQDATWVLAFGSGAALRLLSPGPSSLARSHVQRGTALLAGALGGLFAFWPQLAMWHYLSGTALSGPTPYLNSYAGSFGWPLHVLDALFSTRHGAVLWHPWLALGLAGLVGLAWSRPTENQAASLPAAPALRRLAWVGLTGFLLQTVLIGSWSMWWAGASFGNRFFISALPVLAVGAAELAARVQQAGRPVRWTGVLVLLLLIAWNGALLLQYALEMIPREMAVSPSDMLNNLPRLLTRLLHR